MVYYISLPCSVVFQRLLVACFGCVHLVMGIGWTGFILALLFTVVIMPSPCCPIYFTALSFWLCKFSKMHLEFWVFFKDVHLDGGVGYACLIYVISGLIINRPGVAGAVL